MCGIVAYIGPKQAPQVVMNGLKQLEYRGYDSAGVAVIEQNGAISLRRDVGKLANLEEPQPASPARSHRHRSHALGHPRCSPASATPIRT